MDELDLLMNHYEVRQEYATEIGRAMSTVDDTQLLQVGLLAARATAGPTADHPVGRLLWSNVGTGLSGLANVDELGKAIRVASQIMDENDEPEDNRWLFLRPSEYNVLVEDGRYIDRDFNDAGNGSRAQGLVRTAFGFTLVKTNNLPSTDLSADTGVFGNANQHTSSPDQNNYRADFSATVALALHRDAIGTAQLMGVRTSVTFKEEYQAWLIMGKQAVGHGILRPSGAIEFSDVVTAPTADALTTNNTNVASL